jgi:hypothetical protein
MLIVITLMLSFEKYDPIDKVPNQICTFILAIPLVILLIVVLMLMLSISIGPLVTLSDVIVCSLEPINVITLGQGETDKN